MSAALEGPSIAILGIRGIPAVHGGFETFAERLALHLVASGWRVTVYCQDETIDRVIEDEWEGVHRVSLPSSDDGPLASMKFDWQAIGHVIERRYDLALTLGYNTAAFCSRLRLAGIPNMINMDGIEWARAKWSWPIKAWFYLNDWLGCLLGNRLVADHPEIRRLLATRTRQDKILMIPYGADSVLDAPVEPLAAFGLEPGRYFTVIARPEPENSILEIVRAFSSRRRGLRLCVLGRYDPQYPYHARVMEAASDEVDFVGPIFDKPILRSLRYHSLAYVHGHQVGGTNPSLVEALGAGNPVLGHDNRFNRWVAGDAGLYFSSVEECAAGFDRLEAEPQTVARLRAAARARHDSGFSWLSVLETYESALADMLPANDDLLQTLPHRDGL